MGSDNNCNNYYNIDPSSVSSMASSPYYQTLSSQNAQSQSSIMKNDWNSEPNSDANSSSQNQDSEESENQNMRSGSESSSSQSHKSYGHSSPSSSQQHLQMSAPQWSFSSSLGNSYQRFYGDSHYNITSNGSQQSSLHSTPSSSLHSLNSDIQPHHQTLHHMQTNQHLKKIYYQGLNKFPRENVEFENFEEIAYRFA